MVYGILFAASSATLRMVAADEKQLGAEIGFVSILHTWSQELRHHPHVHCVVPGGGLTADGRWVSCRPGFFLPVRVLAAMFRGKFVAQLRAAYEAGELRLQGSLRHLRGAAAFAECLDRAMATPWVVYSKPPFGGPVQVLRYLALSTHRVAIGNRRILEVGEAGVKFRCRDRGDSQHTRAVVLPGVEFLRRFLLHVLPRGFPRIRHYGLLANRQRAVKLATCRLLLAASMPAAATAGVEPTAVASDRCPACKTGRLVWTEFRAVSREPRVIDSS